MADLAIELQKIYDSEINIRLGWLWDAGIEIRFLPPKIGASVVCPRGAPHAAPPGMNELFAFVCHHCGRSVEVPKAPVQ